MAQEALSPVSPALPAADAAIRARIPLRLKTYRQAVEAALAAERSGTAAARWSEGSMLYRRDRPEAEKAKDAEYLRGFLTKAVQGG